MDRVIFTPEIFTLQSIGGISRYFSELFRYWPVEHRRPLVVAGLHSNLYLQGRSGILGFYCPRAQSLRLRLNQRLCHRIADRHPDAVVHQTYYSENHFSSSHPRVVTVHDMIDELFPERSSPVSSAVKRRNCEQADRIIAVSQTTKDDIVRLFQIEPDKITVIHHGVTQPVYELKERRQSLAPTLLYVGQRGEYKNFARLLWAFAGSKFLKRNFQLLAIGGGPFTPAEEKLLRNLGISDRVQQAHGDDRFLFESYRTATALIYPSLYEGFGMPLLEAMAVGTPVICARSSSLPEVAADAAAYFDGTSVEEIQTVLEATLSNHAQLDQLSERGRRRAEHFSWTRCACETMEVYKRCAESRR